MKLSRRDPPEIGISFLDTITCGIGAIILLMVITTNAPLTQETSERALQSAALSNLQQQLLATREAARTTAARIDAMKATIAASHGEMATLKQIAAGVGAAPPIAGARRRAAPADARAYGELEIAQQRLTAEMQRLYSEKRRASPHGYIGGVPIDSEYVVFLIDTSGSMFNYAWPRVIDEIVQTLTVYPHVKGLQVMNDQGTYMYPDTTGHWLDDTPARRRDILARLRTWNIYSKSSPAEGIEAAIEQFHHADHRISLFVYGDEFTGRSIHEVASFVQRLNRPPGSVVPHIRIHAVGFPTQMANPPALQITGVRFAALMRELTRHNGGTFVGLNSFR